MQFLGFINKQGQLLPDPAKVKAVAEWPTPSSRKQLQCFLGFANFYCRFIRKYSKMAAPPNRLTSTLHPFAWPTEAALTRLKKLFTSVPILSHPDPARQFTVEVDASDVGVGAVLSQWSLSDQKLHPCAFFSRRLSPSERNYDVGNHELLAIAEVATLAGGRRSAVRSMEKNLSYLWGTRQGTLGTFFTKPDVLFHQFALDHSVQEADPILSLLCVVGAMVWPVEERVRQALISSLDPGGAPQNSLSGQRFCIGGTPPGPPVILVFTTLCISSSSISGGHPWCGTPKLSSLPAHSAHQNPGINPRLVCSLLTIPRLPGLVLILRGTRGAGESFFRLSLAVQWADGEDESDPGEHAAMCGGPSPERLDLPSSMGRITPPHLTTRRRRRWQSPQCEHTFAAAKLFGDNVFHSPSLYSPDMWTSQSTPGPRSGLPVWTKGVAVSEGSPGCVEEARPMWVHMRWIGWLRRCT